MLVTPEDALQSVRSAILFGAVLPEMRKDVEALANDLSALASVRKEIAAERAGLEKSRASLADDIAQLTALTEQRQKQQAEVEKALTAERERAAQLARRSEDLQELVAKLEQELDRTTRAARLAARSGEEKKATDARTGLAALKDPGRLAPAIAFARAKGTLPLPVNGVRIREYGAADGVGGHEKGLSISARPGAQITAPCDGWVVYAGPFRNYGQLLILNAGDGYHVLLAGMDRISVDLGQFVVTGEPVAVMGGRIVIARRHCDRFGATHFVCGVPEGRNSCELEPVVGGKRQREGSRIMRKTSLILLGAAAGAALTLIGTQPRIVFDGSSARAAASDTYRQLSLFGDVFERVRSDYVEKPDDAKLVESAINGMLAGLDPHSSYMDAKSFRDMQVQTRGEFGGLGIEVTMEDGPDQGGGADRRHARAQGRRHGQRHHHPSRRRAGAGPHPQPGGREDARPGQHQDPAAHHPQGRREAGRGRRSRATSSACARCARTWKATTSPISASPSSTSRPPKACAAPSTT